MAYNYVPRLSVSGIPESGYYNTVPHPWSGGLGNITPLMHYYGRTRPPKGNCTSYCIGRWLEICKGDKSKMEGLLSRRNTGTWDGGAWYECSPSLQVRSGGPQLGDIVCISRGNTWAGHVFVVEELHEDYVVCSQSEYHGVFFHVTQNYRAKNYMGKWYTDRGYQLRGFIRMSDVPSSGPVNFDMPTSWDIKIGEGQYLNEDEELNNAVMGYVAMMNADPTLTLEACCGILGNMYGEVTLNPGCLQVNRPSAGGLVGWDPLSKWSHEASLRGVPWTDGDGQCEWVLSNNYWAYVPKVGWVLYHNFWSPSLAGGMTYDEFKHSTETPERLAELFCYAYEKAGTPHMNRRTEAARRYYNYLMGLNLPFWNFPKNQPYLDGLSVWQMAGNAKPKLIY